MNSALLTLYRSLTRHRLYAALNIGGLALGIAVFLVLYLFVQFERGYDRGLPGADDLWIAKRTLSIPGVPDVDIPSPQAMLTQWRADYPDAVGTRMMLFEVAVQNGDVAIKEHMAQVDANFFALFPFAVIAGDPAAALTSPDTAVITRRTAQKYLGSQSPVGRSLIVVIDGKPHSYRVGALIEDMPANITFPNDIFIALPPGDPVGSMRNLVTVLRFADPATAAARRRQLSAFAARHPDPNFSTGPQNGVKAILDIQPLSSLHLARPRDRATVATLGAVGLLALLLAVVNYINLATARAGLRAREVALRKVLGGTRRSLIVQFLGEALVSVTIAALIGLALVEITLPLVNAAGGTTLAVRYLGSESILLPLAALIGLVALLAGFYPAFMLSRFQPAAVLASVRAPGGTRSGVRLRQALVIFQFAIAIALMIGTTVLVAQIRHMRSSDLGFRREGLVMVPSFGDMTLDTAARQDLMRAFAGLGGVTAITQAATAPSGGSFGIGPMYRPGTTGDKPMVVNNDAGARFFETYGARLLVGRLLDTVHALDDSSGMGEEKPGTPKKSPNIIINRTASARLGFAQPADAIGKPVRMGDAGSATIVGVIEDIRFRSPQDPVDATAYFQRSRDLTMPVLALRYTGDDPRALLDRMQTIWRRIAPTIPYEAGTVDNALYDAFYRADDQRSHLFTIGAALAVLIGCIGLYGLASFDTARRVKEIGIRKTLGASTRDILKLLIGQFLRPVLIANLIAWPLAFFAMRQWLSGFDDRVALSPLFFIGASVVAVAIATLTVIGQAWRVARAEPARALRYE